MTNVNLPQLDGGSSLQGIQGESRILSVQRQLRLNRGQPERLHLRVQREAFPKSCAKDSARAVSPAMANASAASTSTP